MNIFTKINKKNKIEDNLDSWFTFETDYKNITTLTSINKNKDVHIEGRINEPLKSVLLANPNKIYAQYWAPAPLDFRNLIRDKGLPFPNEDIAYSNTVNTGRVLLGRDSSFVIKIKYPNSFYKRLGLILVKPNVKILIVDENSNVYSKIFTINLDKNI